MSDFEGKELIVDPPRWAVCLTAVCGIIISFIGFWGNLLTILALPHTRKLRNAATWFVVNLAAIELIFCVTILPISAVHLFLLKYIGERLFDTNGCRFFVFLRFVIIQAELLSIAAIALNRCVLIAIPKKYGRIYTPRKTAAIILGIWLISIFVMMFPLLGIYGGFNYNPYTNECDFDEYSRIARKLFLVLGFFGPCLIIILSYSYIFYKARESTKRMQSLTNQSTTGEVYQPAAGLRNRDMRIARTIAVIFLAYLLCCSPVTIAHYYGDQGQIPTTLLLMHPLYWLQYCINMFIYVLMNNQYREAYVTYISHWWPRFRELTEKCYKPTEDETSTSNHPGVKAGSKQSSGRSKKGSIPSIRSFLTPKKSNPITSKRPSYPNNDSPVPSPCLIANHSAIFDADHNWRPDGMPSSDNHPNGEEFSASPKEMVTFVKANSHNH